jgi:hypothetical protein
VLVLKYSTVAGKILTTERTKAQHKHEAPWGSLRNWNTGLTPSSLLTTG